MRPPWRRRPAPVTLTAADRPAPAGSGLWPDETALLDDIARSAARIPHAPATVFEGEKIADFLRRRIPAASDAELARVVACFMFVTRHITAGTDEWEACPVAALWESLGAAALHLTAIDRMTGVPS